MKNRFGMAWYLRGRIIWSRVRDSLWFLPTLAAIGAGVAATFAVRIPRTGILPEPIARTLLYGGGADGARGVLTAISGSIITVTATVFSVTIVALQLSGSQYTPRALRGFLADRANQVVLAIFIGTFTYSLLVLRMVRGGGEDLPAFVPGFAVSFGVLLALVSIGALIFFVNHAARSIQVSVILDREMRSTMKRIEELFPPLTEADPGDDASGDRETPGGPIVRFAAEGAAPADGNSHAATDDPPDPDEAHICASKGGYVAAVQFARLLKAAEAKDVVIRMLRRNGEYVYPGEAIAAVCPRDHIDEELVDTLRDAVMLGPERTPEQDPEYGIVELSDIAVRAMSPGLNDPTTAMLAVDRLGGILVHMGQRALPAPPHCGKDGRTRVVPCSTTFARALGLSFDQLRYASGDHPAVARKLVDTLARVRALVAPRHQPAIDDHVRALLGEVRVDMENPADRASVEALAEKRARKGAQRG